MPLPPTKVPKKLLIAGLIMTFLPQVFLYVMKKAEDNADLKEQVSETVKAEQIVEDHTPQNFYLQGFLWSMMTVGVICLVVAFKKTVPNPEDKLFEEEWDKKGR